jgi:hypothetical protein
MGLAYEYVELPEHAVVLNTGYPSLIVQRYRHAKEPEPAETVPIACAGNATSESPAHRPSHTSSRERKT